MAKKAKKYVAVTTVAFLQEVEDHLKDHKVASKAAEQRRQQELIQAGVLRKRPARMTAKKK